MSTAISSRPFPERLSGNLLVILIWALSIGLTVRGLAQLDWSRYFFVQETSAMVRYWTFILLAATSIITGAWVTKRAPLVIAAVCGLILSIIANAVGAIAFVVAFALACGVVGEWFFRMIGFGQKETRWPLAFTIGAGLYGSAVGLLAHWPINYPSLYGFAVLLPLVLGRRTAYVQLSALNVWQQKNADRTHISWLEVAVGTVALIHFAVALMPEVGFDALCTHLFVASHLTQRHQWDFDVQTYVWAVMPMLGDWIYSIAHMLSGETAARLINLSFIGILAWLIREMVIWAGGTSKGGWIATLIFLCTPLTFTESNSLFIESVWTACVIAGVFLTLKISADQKEVKPSLTSAALLLGFALSAKLITVTLLPGVLLVLAWRAKRWMPQLQLRDWVLPLCLFSAVGLTPYITAWWLTGNPVFPFFNAIFKSPYFETQNFNNPFFNSGVTWDLPYRVIFESKHYLEGESGSAGFQWLLLLPASLVLLCRGWQLKALAIFGIGVLALVITFSSQSYLRYVFPTVVLFSISIGCALSHRTNEGHRVGWIPVAACVATVLLNLTFLQAAAFYRDFPLKTLLSEQHRNSYLAQRQPIRIAVDIVNQINKGGHPVAVLGPELAAGLAAHALYATWYNRTFERDIHAAQSDKELARVLKERQAKYVVLNANWGSIAQRGYVESATEKIADVGYISIRRLKNEFVFSDELVRNADLASSEGWSVSEGASMQPDQRVLRVSSASPAWQSVPVLPEQPYLNTITARCAGSQTQGRLQVNWLDSKMKFIDTSIEVFDCSKDWETRERLVVSPPTAAHAVVYASGHTPVPLEFQQVSFR